MKTNKTVKFRGGGASLSIGAKLRGGIFLFALMICFATFAHDSDTLAFYAFKERPSETPVNGVTVTNAAGDKYNGTVALGTAPQNSIIYTNDVPGAYVFDSYGYGANIVCTNPQSLYFAGKYSEGNQVISFSDLATAISSNDDYTVEFFVKMDPADSAVNYWIGMLKMECGMLYNPGSNPTAAEKAYAGTAQLTRTVFVNSATSATLYTIVKHATYHSIRTEANELKGVTGSSYCDGYWHHYALVYKASTRKMTHYLDYGLAKGSYTVTNSVVEVSKPVLLGNGGFRGLVSCLRVSKTARDTGSFLRCSPNPVLGPETVFHWRLDGENGAGVHTVSNMCTQWTTAFPGQYIGSVDSANGNGTAVAWTNANDVEIRPLYTNEVPRSSRGLLMSGDTKIGKNGGSARLIAKTHTTEAYSVSGAYLALPGENNYPICSGSFTMEAWMKFDYATWKKKIIDAGTFNQLWRLTLFGLVRDRGFHYDWVLNLVSRPENNPEPQGMAISIQAYDQSSADGRASGKSFYENGFLFDNKWHHFAVVYDDPIQTFKVYVDGKLKINKPLDTPFRPHTISHRYAVGYECNNSAFEGLVDEVRLVRRALDPSEFLKFRSAIAVSFR